MKKKSAFYSRISSTAMVYSLTVLFNCAMRFFEKGADSQMPISLLLELYLIVIVIQLIDAVVARLIDKLYVFLVVNFFVMLAAVYGLGLLFGWHDPGLSNFWPTALMVLAIYTLVYRFLVAKHRLDTAKINAKLAEMNAKETPA